MTVSVSIIVPVFNGSATLQRTLDSIKKQTFSDIEVLCVDDCSTDDTRSIIDDYAQCDPRFKLLRLAQNGGVAAARNEGIKFAQGKYLCFLDSDDWWQPTKLEVQFGYMESSGAAISYMSYSRMNEQGGLLNNVVPPSSVTYDSMLYTNSIGNLTAMVRSQFLGMHRIRFKKIGHEDYLFWLSMVKQAGRAQCVPSSTSLCCYTVRQGSLSSSKLIAAQWQWAIYRQELGLNLGVSLKYFVGYVAASLKKRFL